MRSKVEQEKEDIRETYLEFSEILYQKLLSYNGDKEKEPIRDTNSIA